MNHHTQRIASELDLRLEQVAAAVHRTLPQGTDRNLDDKQLRQLKRSLLRLRALGERCETASASIQEQRQLTPMIHQQLLTALKDLNHLGWGTRA